MLNEQRFLINIISYINKMGCGGSKQGVQQRPGADVKLKA